MMPGERDYSQIVAKKLRVGFSDDAAAVINDNPAKAKRLNHNGIGTEHLLWSLADVDSPAKIVLGNLGVEAAKVGGAVGVIIGRGDRISPREFDFTPLYKRVIELGRTEAMRRLALSISSTDLLIGLISNGEGVACGVLETLGVSLDRVRYQTNFVLEQIARETPKVVELTHGQKWQISRIAQLYEDPSIPQSLKDSMYAAINEQVIGFEGLAGNQRAENSSIN